MGRALLTVYVCRNRNPGIFQHYATGQILVWAVAAPLRKFCGRAAKQQQQHLTFDQVRPQAESSTHPPSPFSTSPILPIRILPPAFERFLVLLGVTSISFGQSTLVYWPVSLPRPTTDNGFCVSKLTRPCRRQVSRELSIRYLNTRLFPNRPQHFRFAEVRNTWQSWPNFLYSACSIITGATLWEELRHPGSPRAVTDTAIHLLPSRQDEPTLAGWALSHSRWCGLCRSS